MFCSALGRVSNDGNRERDHKEEVQDEAPVDVGGELNPVIERILDKMLPNLRSLRPTTLPWVGY